MWGRIGTWTIGFTHACGGWVAPAGCMDHEPSCPYSFPEGSGKPNVIVLGGDQEHYEINTGGRTRLYQLSSSSPSIQDIDEIQDWIHDALHMALTTTTTTTAGSGGHVRGAAAWDDDDLLTELASLSMADDDKDPKKGTTRHTHDKDNDTQHPNWGLTMGRSMNKRR